MKVSEDYNIEVELCEDAEESCITIYKYIGTTLKKVIVIDGKSAMDFYESFSRSFQSVL